MNKFDGYCDNNGFHPTKTHDQVGNCTLRENSFLTADVMITGCIRNINPTKLVNTTFPYIDSVFEESRRRNLTAGAIVYVDDATDIVLRRTVEYWMKDRKRTTIILSRVSLGERIQRLSLCRNVLLAEAKRRMRASGFVLSLDMDCTPLQHSSAIFDALRTTPSYDVVTANNPGPYRDMWALRSQTLMRAEYDCFWDFQKMRQFGNCKRNRILVNPTASPLYVGSAFNGMAIYKNSILFDTSTKTCRYANESVNPDDKKHHIVSEHIPYHNCLVQRGKRISILPSLLTFCHIWKTHHNARRFEYKSNSSTSFLLSNSTI